MKKIINEFMGVSNIYMELIQKTEKVKRNYGEIELYPSEIHTLVFIQENSEINMTEIAKKMGVTKGAIFKIIKKIEEKELISKYKKVENNKNTYFKLTSKGLRAYNAHEKFHKEFFGNPSDEFVDFANKNKEVILTMFDFTKEYLNQHLEKIDLEGE